VMRGGIVHSDAMSVQVDVIFNPRVEPSIYERLNTKDLLTKQGAFPFNGQAHSRYRSRESRDLSIINDDHMLQ